jgi:hypothetical protein
VLVLEGFSQFVAVVGTGPGALRPVGHDDVRVTVRVFAGTTVRMLDDLHQPVDMRSLAEVMPVNVLFIVLVWYGPMLPAGRDHARRRPTSSRRVRRVAAATSSGLAWAIA